jgi:hypothetical protein
MALLFVMNRFSLFFKLKLLIVIVLITFRVSLRFFDNHRPLWRKKADYILRFKELKILYWELAKVILFILKHIFEFKELLQEK